MSDTVKKWHEMQEDKLDDCCGADCGCHDDNMSSTMDVKFIYESPDGGETVTRRPFMSDISEREVIQKPVIDPAVKKDAYTILSVYSEDAVRLAAKILDVGE